MISEASMFLLLRIFPIPSKHSIKMKQECDIHLQFVKLGYKSKVPWADSDGEESVSGPPTVRIQNEEVTSFSLMTSSHPVWRNDITLLVCNPHV